MYGQPSAEGEVVCMKRVVNVHSRVIPAPPATVGALLDTLGSPDDRVFPAAAWPTTPFVLDGPLAVGAAGRLGSLALVVEELASGRRLVFRFADGQGVAGHHRFDIEPTGQESARLTHRLECTFAARLRPIAPIFLRQHDALVEDLFDRLELGATGRVAHPARWPLAVRIANAIELRAQGFARYLASPAGRGRDVAAVAVPATLAGLAALHAAWALGWRWPGGDDEAFAARVMGYGVPVPPAPATWTVAALLGGAAGAVRAAALPGASSRVRSAAAATAALFALRGALSIPVDVVRGFDDVYERLDLAVYSPLCLAIGAGTAAVLRPAEAPAASGSLS
jgi:hypothetical protein